MNKNIICTDGTGNNDVKAMGTNVFKLYVETRRCCFVGGEFPSSAEMDHRHFERVTMMLKELTDLREILWMKN